MTAGVPLDRGSEDLPETVISLTGGGRTESVIPRDGRFEFTGLAPGVYSLAASAVPGMTGHATREISLTDARACAQADVYFHHDTSVSGHLRRADGTPAANVGVELAPSGTWRDQPMRTTSSVVGRTAATAGRPACSPRPRRPR